MDESFVHQNHLETHVKLIKNIFFKIDIKKPVSNLFLFSLLFGLTEFLRGNILTGFPWNLIAFSFSENLEILQILSFIGTLFMLILLQIVLGFDNLLYIALESKKAPKEKQSFVRKVVYSNFSW